MKKPNVEFSVLKGKTLLKIDVIRDKQIIFHTHDGLVFKMFHEQDCCEYVVIDDICGEIGWLLNSPILIAEERSNRDEPKNKNDESFTWTFYEIATLQGAVTIRWYGCSSGYYSESVDFVEVKGCP